MHARTIHVCILGEKGDKLLRGGNFPVAYVYPRAMRSTRDLLRRRLYFVRKRAELIAQLRILNGQYNLPEDLGRIAQAKNREGLGERFSDPAVAKSVWANLELLDHYDELIAQLERYLLAQAKVFAGLRLCLNHVGAAQRTLSSAAAPA